MAIVCGLFNDNNGKNVYDDTEMAILHSLLKHDKGIVVEEGDELKVTLGTGLEVKVGTGAAWIGEPCGWFMKNDAEVSVPIDTEVEGYKRSDRIILKLDRNISALDITIQVKKGSPAASEPVAPEVEQNSMVFELSLATVTVTGGANEIGLIDDRGFDYTEDMVQFEVKPSTSGQARAKIEKRPESDGVKLYYAETPFSGGKVSDWGTLFADITDDTQYHGADKWLAITGLTDGTRYYFKGVQYKNGLENEVVGHNEDSCIAGGLTHEYTMASDTISGTTVNDGAGGVALTSVNVTYDAGVEGNCAVFYGNGDMSTATRIYPDTGTIIVNFHPKNISESYKPIFSRAYDKTSTTQRYGIEVYLNSSFQLVIRTGSGGASWNALTFTDALSPDEWHKLVIKVDGGVFTVKVDGVEMVNTSGSIVDPAISTYLKFYLAAIKDNVLTKQGQIKIDLFSTYNRLLEDDEE